MNTETVEKLMRKQNVVSVGRGKKIQGGVDTGRKAIVVGVAKKLSREQVKRKDLVPKKVKGGITDVVEVGEIQLLQAVDPERLEKHRPAPGGISVGNFRITAGTLGCWVKKGGQYLILSNNHVLANCNNCQVGDAILQPGKYDGGVLGKDDIALLSEYVPLHIQEPFKPEITLIQPKGGEVWEIGKTVTIKWETNITEGNFRIEISFDGGNHWYTLISSIPCAQKEIGYEVNVQETDQARMKMVFVEDPRVYDISDSDFTIKKAPSPPPSQCKFSQAVATTLNIAWASFGKATRFQAVVYPVPQQLPPAIHVDLKSHNLGINLVDCALAKPIKQEDIDDRILGIDSVLEEITEPELNMKLKKSGRTTAVTLPIITQDDVTVDVDMGEGRKARFEDQFIAEGPHCARPGDSGSLVLTEDGKRVGLLFAGAPDMLVANKYSNVKALLGLD